jgi:hypothetical protein
LTEGEERKSASTGSQGFPQRRKIIYRLEKMLINTSPFLFLLASRRFILAGHFIITFNLYKISLP